MTALARRWRRRQPPVSTRVPSTVGTALTATVAVVAVGRVRAGFPGRTGGVVSVAAGIENAATVVTPTTSVPVLRGSRVGWVGEWVSEWGGGQKARGGRECVGVGVRMTTFPPNISTS